MCLSVPAKVLEVRDGRAVVESRGWTREVDASLVAPAVGDYVLVQMGVVLEIMDRKEALEALEVLDRVYAREAPGGA